VTPTSCSSTPYLSSPVPNFAKVLLPPNSPRLPVTPNRMAPPSTMIDNCWASPVVAAQNSNDNPMHYRSTHPSQLARVLTESLVSTTTTAVAAPPRPGILPRPSKRFQPEHILQAPAMSTQPTTECSTGTKACASASPRRKKPKTSPKPLVAAPRDAAPPSPRQPEEIDDADAFLSFVQSVNNRPTDISNNTKPTS
jgi:hypothetical protein